MRFNYNRADTYLHFSNETEESNWQQPKGSRNMCHMAFSMIYSGSNLVFMMLVSYNRSTTTNVTSLNTRVYFKRLTSRSTFVSRIFLPTHIQFDLFTDLYFCLKPWPNASSRKLKTWVYLRLRLASSCVHLLWLAMTCAHFGPDEIYTQNLTVWPPNSTQRRLSDVH